MQKVLKSLIITILWNYYDFVKKLKRRVFMYIIPQLKGEEKANDDDDGHGDQARDPKGANVFFQNLHIRR